MGHFLTALGTCVARDLVSRHQSLPGASPSHCGNRNGTTCFQNTPWGAVPLPWKTLELKDSLRALRSLRQGSEVELLEDPGSLVLSRLTARGWVRGPGPGWTRAVTICRADAPSRYYGPPLSPRRLSHAGIQAQCYQVP